MKCNICGYNFGTDNDDLGICPDCLSRTNDPKLIEFLRQTMEMLEAVTLVVATRKDPYDLSPRMERLRKALADLEGSG